MKIVVRKSSGLYAPARSAGRPSSTASPGRPADETKDKPSARSRIVAVFLCLFLGFYSLHRFYAGRIWTGLVQAMVWLCLLSLMVVVFMAKVMPATVAVGVVGCLLLLGTGIWWLIDMVLILMGVFRDGRGQKLREW